MASLYLPNQKLEVVKYTSFTEIDTIRLRAGIDNSFAHQKKKLVENYFDITTPLAIYLVGNYAAGAITKDLEGTVYVCKFFVNPAVGGNGLSKGLLKCILEDIGIEPEDYHDNSIILRTDVKNKQSNGLYLTVFSGEYRGGANGVKSSDGKHKWTVHQIGLKGEDLEKKLQLVADLPVTMASISTQPDNN